jgi:UDP-N-acetylglucosamine--N-acetylmuramyl-(pentapeptide) pyrophosphoryl-undecaprenol N-acetylglucosamine transferase
MKENKRLHIVLTGGGTGGHITPTLAVARELKRLRPDCSITYVIERNARFGELVRTEPAVDNVRFIFAGKLRRYHGETWLRRLTDVRTIFFNVRDVVYLAIGLLQSLWLMLRLKPDVVFVKGGYVGLPVGIAAAFQHRPIITHDSDTVPGLTNRIVARWARVTATAYPAKFYTYPPAKVQYVGVPVAEEITPVNTADKLKLRQELGVPEDAKILLVTGGSQGAVRLNKAVATILPEILARYTNAYVIHQTGAKSGGLYKMEESERVMAREFLQPLWQYSGAADVIIARPGASSMAEFAAQGKACIVVPSAVLADGHQLKNAAHLADQSAALNVAEGANLAQDLLAAVQDLLDHPAKAAKLAQTLHDSFRPDAAKRLAMVLLEQVN